jgi:hypothetical protein
MVEGKRWAPTVNAPESQQQIAAEATRKERDEDGREANFIQTSRSELKLGSRCVAALLSMRLEFFVFCFLFLGEQRIKQQ